jgi:hypothetical protein
MKSLKTFVIWLLLSLLPLQGIAINVGMTCDTGRAGGLQTQAWADDAQASLQHQQDADMHCSDRAVDGSTGQMADFLSNDGSCGAYCAGAAWMHVAEVALPAAMKSSGRIADIDFHLPFVVPEGPEHRPRFPLI